MWQTLENPKVLMIKDNYYYADRIKHCVRNITKTLHFEHVSK